MSLPDNFSGGITGGSVGWQDNRVQMLAGLGIGSIVVVTDVLCFFEPKDINRVTKYKKIGVCAWLGIEGRYSGHNDNDYSVVFGSSGRTVVVEKIADNPPLCCCSKKCCCCCKERKK